MTGGFLQMTVSHGPLQLTGERGFSLSSNVSAGAGIFNPFEQCSLVQCEPGAEVSLGAEWSSNDLTGRLTFEGQTYDDLGDVNSATQALVRFSGSFIAPPTAPAATLTAPFAFTGQFAVPTGGPHLLIGGGIATINLSPQGNTQSWRVDSVHYDFAPDAAPIPEPATLLMVGLGAAALARRKMRPRWTAR